MYVYIITNNITNKQYVGITTRSISERWRSHISVANGTSNGHMKITSSLRKYGKENFSVSQLDTASTIEELNEKEQYWISKLNTRTPNGYNITSGGRYCKRGPMSKETKEKLSKYRTGRPGVKLSKEAKQKIGTKSKQRMKDPTRRMQLGNYMRGRRKFLTLEHRAKIRETLAGGQSTPKNLNKKPVVMLDLDGKEIAYFLKFDYARQFLRPKWSERTFRKYAKLGQTFNGFIIRPLYKTIFQLRKEMAEKIV